MTKKRLLRSARLTISLLPESKRILKKAADISNQPLGRFLESIAIQRAKDIINESTTEV
jgi:uncharacterized protein (DUF1778 family)